MPKQPVPSKRTDEDYDLIQAINSGHMELFHELVRKYEDKLYNFGLRMCGDASDAEDMVQETFLNVFKYLKGFRHETKFKNWLYKVAASTCLKKKRKSKFAPDRELSLDEFIPGQNDQLPVDIPQWALMPLEQLLNAELFDTLNRGVLELPEKYRLVIVLRDMEGFSSAETAQILGISVENVKVRLHRARLFLRDQLKTYFKND
jgi:RNA polymerase sigma-70 factor (ECF subfamily)